jgi:hypothetical protein
MGNTFPYFHGKQSKSSFFRLSMQSWSFFAVVLQNRSGKALCFKTATLISFYSYNARREMFNLTFSASSMQKGLLRGFEAFSYPMILGKIASLFPHFHSKVISFQLYNATHKIIEKVFTNGIKLWYH